VNWYVHLSVNSSLSVVGPFDEKGARDTAEMMVEIRNSQGYGLSKVNETLWQSATHRVEIQVKEGK